jgi:hypothetical protein
MHMTSQEICDDLIARQLCRRFRRSVFAFGFPRRGVTSGDGLLARGVPIRWMAFLLYRSKWFGGGHMIRKICSALFILVVILCASSIPLVAQAPCAGKMAIYNYTFLNGDTNSWPKGCVWAGASPIAGDYWLECWTSSCPPPRWCPDCNGKGVPISGAPINLTNGNTYIQERDVTIPGLGGGLTLKRTWNSIWPAALSAFQTGMFGSGWRSTYEERVFTGSGVYSGYHCCPN